MPRGARACCLSSFVFLLCAAALLLCREQPPTDTSWQVLAADGELNWYRGNIHTHSLESDGNDYREMIALWYKERGYNFLCFTDHNLFERAERWTDVLANKGNKVAYEKLKARFPGDWVEERTVKNDAGEDCLQIRLKSFAEVSDALNSPGQFLLIQGEEISSGFQKRPIHMNATNLKEPLPPATGDSVYEVIQANTDLVVGQRERTGQPMLVHLNHPNYHYGITAEDLMRVRGENFFEVYNGHTGVHNSGDAQHAPAERMWDIINTRRLTEFELPLMYGLATDDGHEYHNIPDRQSNPGRGWVMVLAPKLTPGDLIGGLERGEFYASSGVFLDRIATNSEGMTFEIRPEQGVRYTIEFVGTRKGFDPTSQPVLDKEGKEVVATRRYSDDIGKVFATISGTKGEYRFAGDELYVRARITSTKQHPNPSEIGDFECAWVQPLRGPAAPEVK